MKKRNLKSLSSTAELTIGLILSLLRKIPSAVNSVNEGKWETKNFRGFELKIKKLGIIGFGRLGKIVAKIAKGFEMKVSFYDPYVNLYNKSFKKIQYLPDLIKISDIVSLHVPLNEETYKMISEKN